MASAAVSGPDFLPPSPQPEATDGPDGDADACPASFSPSSPSAEERVTVCLPTPDTTPTKPRHSMKKEAPPCGCGSSQPDVHQDSTEAQEQKVECKEAREQKVECTEAREQKVEKRPGSGSKLSGSQTQAKLTKSTSLQNISDRPPKGKGRGKARGRPANKKPTTPASSQQRSKSAPSKKQERKPQNHLLTEYFPVRRSFRRCHSDIKKEEEKSLENAILSGCEDGLKVVKFEGKGRGVVSTKHFMRGDFVVEYAGDLVDLKTAKQREKEYTDNPDFGCYMYYFNFNNKSYCVDATAESGKLGRLLNHSRLKPNCRTRVVGIGNQPYLILEAAKDIPPGEELLYDYGDRSQTSLESHPWLAL